MPRMKKADQQLNDEIFRSNIEYERREFTKDKFIEEIRSSPLIVYHNDLPISYFYLMLPQFVVCVGIDSGGGDVIDAWSFNKAGNNGLGFFREFEAQDIDYVLVDDGTSEVYLVQDFFKSFYYDRSTKEYTGGGIIDNYPPVRIHTSDVCRTLSEGNNNFSPGHYNGAEIENAESIDTLFRCWMYAKQYYKHRNLPSEVIINIPMVEDGLGYPLRIIDLNSQTGGQVTYVQDSAESQKVEWMESMNFMDTIYQIDGVEVERDYYVTLRNRLVEAGLFHIANTKNVTFDEFLKLPPNMLFPRMDNYGMAFDYGHSFYVPIGYMIDAYATNKLHKLIPETKRMFCLIRRQFGYWYEGIFRYIANFYTRGVAGNLQQVQAVDWVLHPYPYRYSAAWGTYVHYDEPTMDWFYNNPNLSNDYMTELTENIREALEFSSREQRWLRMADDLYDKFMEYASDFWRNDHKYFADEVLSVYSRKSSGTSAYYGALDPPNDGIWQYHVQSGRFEYIKPNFSDWNYKYRYAKTFEIMQRILGTSAKNRDWYNSDALEKYEYEIKTWLMGKNHGVGYYGTKSEFPGGKDKYIMTVGGYDDDDRMYIPQLLIIVNSQRLRIIPPEYVGYNFLSGARVLTEYPRDPPWKREDIMKSLEILSRYPDFNEQMKNVRGKEDYLDLMGGI